MISTQILMQRLVAEVTQKVLTLPEKVQQDTHLSLTDATTCHRESKCSDDNWITHSECAPQPPCFVFSTINLPTFEPLSDPLPSSPIPCPLVYFLNSSTTPHFIWIKYIRVVTPFGSLIVIRATRPHQEKLFAKILLVPVQKFVLCSAISKQSCPSYHNCFRIFSGPSGNTKLSSAVSGPNFQRAKTLLTRHKPTTLSLQNKLQRKEAAPR